MSLDPRVATNIAPASGGLEPPEHAVAVTSDGYSLRLSLEPFLEPSNRAGRRFARPSASEEVAGVTGTTGEETLIAATAEARTMLCAVKEVKFLSGPAQGGLCNVPKRRTGSFPG